MCIRDRNNSSKEKSKLPRVIDAKNMTIREINKRARTPVWKGLTNLKELNFLERIEDIIH